MPTNVASIMTPFNTMETEELSTNFPKVLSTPDIRGTSDMHNRYGSVMRVSSTARSHYHRLRSCARRRRRRAVYRTKATLFPPPPPHLKNQEEKTRGPP